MGKLRIVQAGDIPWMTGGDDSGDADSQGLRSADASTEAAARFLHPGEDGELQVFEVRLRPGAEAEPHAHERDEVILVTEGEMKFGARVLQPGESVYVPAETLYGFRAGATGARFLNFRATKDLSFVTKQELAARLSAR